MIGGGRPGGPVATFTGMAPVLLRPATPADSPAVAAGRVADTTVADADGEVAGFVMVAGDEVEQVYVSAAHRGSGIAGLLLAEAERQVAAAGHPQAWLAVVPGNTRARRFYERSGWADEGGFDYRAGPVVVAVPALCQGGQCGAQPVPVTLDAPAAADHQQPVHRQAVERPDQVPDLVLPLRVLDPQTG